MDGRSIPGRKSRSPTLGGSLPSPSTRVLIAVVLVGLLTVSAVTVLTPGAAGESGHKNRVLTVMNYNLYQGTELQEVVRATSLGQFLVAVATDYGHSLANNFSQRAQAIAAEVASADPDLLSLQEVSLWRTQFPSNPHALATTVAADYLQILQTALAAAGLNYTVLVVRANLDVQGTGLFPFGLMDVRLTDRAAILVKTDDLGGDISVSNAQQQDFTVNTVIHVLGSPITILDGWASVDLNVRGETIRFLTTHLDPFSGAARLAQAKQILSGPANTTLPVLLAGDFNSLNTSSSYAALIAGGLGDQWVARNPGLPGYTCCRTPPDIINASSPGLSERLDLVLASSGFSTISAELTGTDPTDMTGSGLWPSDHAGLVVTLRLP